MTNKQIAEKRQVDPRTVSLWRRRFATLRLSGIEKDAPRPWRTPRLSLKVAKAKVVKILRTKLRGRTHWSTRVIAREVGVGHVTFHRIWRRYG